MKQTLMELVAADVLEERKRQWEKWGHQEKSLPEWYAILGEEVGEVAQAIVRKSGEGKETDKEDAYTELIHVAATAQKIAMLIRGGYIEGETYKGRERA